MVDLLLPFTDPNTHQRYVHWSSFLRGLPQNGIQNPKHLNFRYCETEDDRGWDYCCRPEHRCGYSDGFRYTQLSREKQKIVLGIKRTQHDRYFIAATLGVLLVRLVTTSGVLVMLRGLVLGTGFCLLFYFLVETACCLD